MTRREAIAAFAAAWPAVLAAQDHARHMATAADGRLEHFDAKTAAEVEAIAAQIIPSTDTPGAREAGIIYFIDRALMTFDKRLQDSYRFGLAEVQETRKGLFPGSTSIASLGAEQQIKLLKTIETSVFFKLVRTHTIMGFFCDPSRGGNRDEAGWKLIGFEDKFQFEPPFGYYDRG
jgi:gluconate 2-dehydrogenase gamma chain